MNMCTIGSAMWMSCSWGWSARADRYRGLYGPLMPKPLARKFDQSRRLNYSDYGRGIEIIKCVNPKQVYVYAMGQEPWLTFLTSIQYTDHSRLIVEANRLVEDCRRLQIKSERLYGQKEIHL
jgi:hypothetical protein